MLYSLVPVEAKKAYFMKYTMTDTTVAPIEHRTSNKLTRNKHKNDKQTKNKKKQAAKNSK